MTRWSEGKEVLSDSSIKDIPEIVNEDFVSNTIVNDEIVSNEIVNKKIVESLIVNDGFLREDDDSIQRTAEEREAINDEVTIVKIIIITKN